MQVLLNTTALGEERQTLTEELQTVVREALGHYGERITKVDAYLSDENGKATTHTDEIHCILEARLVGLGPVTVMDGAATARQAIHGALHKLESAVGSAFGKHVARQAESARAAVDL